MREPARITATRHILVLLVLVLAWALAACAGQQPASAPAGTATQDPPVPQLTEATHGIVDTTGTVPQGFLEQLRSRSDESRGPSTASNMREGSSSTHRRISTSGC